MIPDEEESSDTDSSFTRSGTDDSTRTVIKEPEQTEPGDILNNKLEPIGNSQTRTFEDNEVDDNVKTHATKHIDLNPEEVKKLLTDENLKYKIRKASELNLALLVAYIMHLKRTEGMGNITFVEAAEFNNIANNTEASPQEGCIRNGRFRANKYKCIP